VGPREQRERHARHRSVAGLPSHRHALLQPPDAHLRLVAEIRDCAQIAERERHGQQPVARAVDGESLLGDRLGTLDIADTPVQEGERVERGTAVPRRGRAGLRQSLFEPHAAFLKVATSFPEAKQGRGGAQHRLVVTVIETPTQRHAQVRVLDLKPIKRGDFVRSEIIDSARLGQP
jgi:hypothetical protein